MHRCAPLPPRVAARCPRARRAPALALTGTAALYAPGRGGAAERAIKSAWWKQVLDPALSTRFPKLALISWFEWDKQEREIHGRVNWGVTRDAALLAGYRAALPSTLRYAGC